MKVLVRLLLRLCAFFFLCNVNMTNILSLEVRVSNCTLLDEVVKVFK